MENWRQAHRVIDATTLDAPSTTSPDIGNDGDGVVVIAATRDIQQQGQQQEQQEDDDEESLVSSEESLIDVKNEQLMKTLEPKVLTPIPKDLLHKRRIRSPDYFRTQYLSNLGIWTNSRSREQQHQHQHHQPQFGSTADEM